MCILAQKGGLWDGRKVAVLTAVQTPRFCGADCSTAFFLKELNVLCRAGAVDFFTAV